MKFTITYDSSVTPGSFTGGAAEEADFKSALNYVVNLLDNLFTNNVTINLDVGWGEVGGTPIGPALAHNTPTLVGRTWSDVQTALNNTAAASGEAVQLAAYSTLPSTDPSGGNGIKLFTAQEKAIGLLAANAPGTDASVGFNSTDDWSFTPGVTPSPFSNYFIGSAEHEITEAMGRLSSPLSDTLASYTVADLFRYTSPGVRDKTPGTGGTGSTSYFSYDGGGTKLGTWNNQFSNGDLLDWFPTGPAPDGNDSFNDFSNSGAVNALTMTDLQLMNVLGWDTSVPSGGSVIPQGVTGWIPRQVTSAGIVVQSGGYLEVAGTALSTFVHAGGLIQIDASGTGTNTVLSGTETVFGTDDFAVVAGAQTVSSGGTSVTTTVLSGGTETVASGGTASATIVEDGGLLEVAVGGVAHNTAVLSGGAVEIFSGGATTSTTVGSGGTEVVGFLFGGGKATGTTVDAGGIQYVQGTSVKTVLHGGAQNVLSGGVASGTIVSGGGLETVYAGGTAKGAIVHSGGELDVLSGGSASGTIMSGGGLETVSAGGTAKGTIVHSGGELDIDSGGVASGTQIDNGGTDLVVSGATTHGTIVSSGGTESIGFLVKGGTAIGSVVSGGGIESDFGTTSKTTLRGGEQFVLSGGVASGTVISAGGEEHVADGGVTHGTVISGGGSEVVSSGGTASGTQVSSGGELDFRGGATGSSTTVHSGGLETDLGTTHGTIVQAGATEIVSASGAASGTTSGATVNNGGIEIVASGGTAFSTMVKLGGTQDVLNGGKAVGTVVQSGGQEIVFSAGIVNGATLSGGTLELQPGSAAGGSTITFAGGGTLKLGAAETFGGKVAGFGIPDELDLGDIAFGASTTIGFSEAGNHLSGTLTVSDGINTANITLLGQYIAGQFTSATDGAGGTIIGDPPLIAVANTLATTHYG